MTAQHSFKNLATAEKWRKKLDAARELGWGHVQQIVAELTGEPNVQTANQATSPTSAAEVTLDDFMRQWFAEDGPELSTATLEKYTLAYFNHIAEIPLEDGIYAGHHPLEEFSDPMVVSFLFDALRTGWKDDVRQIEQKPRNPPTITSARAALSSGLSWGVERGRLSGNGVRKITKRNRKKNRTGHSGNPDRDPVRGKALNAVDYVCIREALLARARGRTFHHERDAGILAALFCGLRPEEAFALRWSDIRFGDGKLVVYEALSDGKIDAPKTRGSRRFVPLCPPLSDDLYQWRNTAVAAGLPMGRNDPVFPGTTPWGGFSKTQAKSWGRKYFGPAAADAARRSGRKHLALSKPYSARRGYISCRLAAGDLAKAVATDAGTSVETINKYYFFDVSDDPHERVPSFTEQLVRAKAAAESNAVREPDARAA